jgi:hypothetical protein
MIRKANTVSPSGHHLSMCQLIMALPLIATPPAPLILSACPCLLTCHLHLPPLICLSFAPAGCRITSYCATFATHPLDTQPPFNALAGCSNASCHPASAACPVGALLPLNAPPTSPTSICLSFALAGGCITFCRTTFATHPLYALPPLNASAGCSIASHCAAFATHLLDVPPPLNTPAGCSIASHCTASATHPLSVSLPLNMLPPSPTSHLPFVCPGWLSDCKDQDRRGL